MSSKGLIDPMETMHTAINNFRKDMMHSGATKEEAALRFERENGIFHLICPPRIFKKMLQHLERSDDFTFKSAGNGITLIKDNHGNKINVHERTFSAKVIGFIAVYSTLFTLKESIIEETPIGKNLVAIRKVLKRKLRELGIPNEQLKLLKGGRLSFDSKTGEYISKLICHREDNTEKYFEIRMRHTSDCNTDKLIGKAIAKLEKIINNCKKGA